jgi:hypothetical protein
MGKRIIVTKKQYDLIKENITHSNMVETLVSFLNKNYEPAYSVKPGIVEYSEEPSFKVKVDERIITPNELLEYMKFKFPKTNETFIKQTINDWSFGRIDKNNMLTKNVSVNQ